MKFEFRPGGIFFDVLCCVTGGSQTARSQKLQTLERKSFHPSLHFKRIGKRMESYSVRIGIGWRAVGVKSQDTVIWFWIGSHAEYDRLVESL